MMRNPALLRRTVVAGSLTGVVLMGAMAGCVRPTEPALQDLAAVADRLDQLSEQIGGTPKQRTAGQVLQYHVYQDGIRDCMARAGFTYDPPRFVDPYRGRSVIHMGIGTGQWLAPLGRDRLGVTDTAERVGPQEDQGPSASYRRLSRSEKDRFERALTDCVPRAMPEVSFPPAYHPLSEKYNDMLADVSKDDAVKAAGETYPACMAEGGLPVHSHDELVELIQARMGDAQPPKPNTEADARWSSVVALEQKAARLDTECRQPAYDVALRVVAPAVVDFERANEADLALVARQWDDMVRRAGAYPEFPG